MAPHVRSFPAFFSVACIIVLFVLNCFSNDPLFPTLFSLGGSSTAGEGGDERASSMTRISRAAVMVDLQPEQQQNYSLGERGYTFCVSEDPALLTSAKYILQTFRTEWKSALPIVIAHCGELSQSTKDVLHAVHRTSAIAAFGKNLTLLQQAKLQIRDLCEDAGLAEKKRLRGWFCKPRALIEAPFQQTMLIDTDLVWFKSPDLLFTSTQYQQTGALFFRDRFLYESTNEKDGAGLIYETVKAYIEHHSGKRLEAGDVLRLLGDGSTNVNYFWRKGLASSGHGHTQDRGLRHIQESSVVLCNRRRHLRTLAVIRRLIPSFRLGYGDKEIYWIAATIAGEPFSFEPYLAGIYGDCGEVVHYEPLPPGKDAQSQPQPQPHFMNGQYLSESVEFEGKGLQAVISKPVQATLSLPLFELGARDPKTGGNCGACKAMGCSRVATDLSAAIVKQQEFQLKYVDPNFKNSLFGIVYYALRRVGRKILPAS